MSYNAPFHHEEIKKYGFRKTIKPRFMVEPNCIIFRDYSIGLKCMKRIKIINNDVICHQINVRHDCPKDLQFKIIGDQRVIPGLHIIIDVTFIPYIDFKRNKNNRIYEIHLISEHAKYKQIIPIIIASTIPTFTFPKEIILPDSSPNIPTYTTLLVFNTCLLEYKLKIQMEENTNFYFSYSPKHNVSLKPNEAEVFIFEFIPQVYGTLECVITVISDNGISNKILIKCNSYPCEVYMNKNKITFPDTFIGLSEMREFQIINNSDKKIKYKFMAFKTIADDKKFQETIFNNVQQYLHDKHEHYDDLQYYEYITNIEENKKFLDKELQINEQELTVMHFPFHSTIFEITPEEGELCPKTKQTICVFFKPSDILPSHKKDSFLYSSSGYLKLATNIDFRPEIIFEGVGLGPKIKVNINEIDVGKISLGEKHWYELVCYNYGIIKGTIHFDSFNASFGGVVNVNPVTLCLNPAKHGTFTLEYSGHKKGKFLEQIYFQIQNGENIEILISGEIIPTLPVYIPSELNFGQVPMCIPQTKYLYLKNLQSCSIGIDIDVRCHGIDEPLFFGEFQNTFDNSDLNSPKEGGIVINDSHENLVKPVSSISLYDDILHRQKSEVFNKNLLFEYHNDDVFKKMLEIEQCECKESSEEVVDNKLEINQFVNQTIDCILKAHDKRGLKSKYISEICEQIFEDAWLHILSLNVVDYNVASFTTRKWCIPNNPKEHKITPDCIIMEPRSSCSIMINLIPNIPGKSSTDILMQISSGTIRNNNSINDNNTPNISNHELLGSKIETSTIKIPLNHICVIPDIELDSTELNLETFFELEMDLIFNLKNKSDATGFCQFKYNKTSKAIIEFIPKKFFVQSKSDIKIKLKVTPLICGTIELFASLHILGDNNSVQLRINCKSLPPEIEVFPGKINELEYPLFQKIQHKLFIHNKTLTRARFIIKEIVSEYFEVYPLGGSLGPEQSIVVLINMFFCDAKCYKQKITIDLFGGETTIVPISIKTSGTSLQFFPDFGDCIDFGVMLLQEKKPSLSYKVHNKGTFKHKLYFKVKPLTKNNKEDSSITSFIIKEEQMVLLPNEYCFLEVILNRDRPCDVIENYILEALIGKDTGRIILKKITIIGKLIEPKLCWNVNNIEFNICFGEPCCTGCAFVTVTNASPLPVKTYCKTEGEYYLKDTDESTCYDDISFDLNTNESRTMQLFFNYDLLYKHTEYIQYFGKVKLKAIDRPQPSVSVVTSLIYPIINVLQSSIYIFALKTSSYAFIDIYNPGPLCASYKWQICDESLCLINVKDSKEQNVVNVTKEILYAHGDFDQYTILEYSDEKILEDIDNLPDLLSDEEELIETKDLSGNPKSGEKTFKSNDDRKTKVNKSKTDKGSINITKKDKIPDNKKKNDSKKSTGKSKTSKGKKLIKKEEPNVLDLIDVSQIDVDVSEAEIKELLNKLTNTLNANILAKENILRKPPMSVLEKEVTKNYPNDFLQIDQFSGNLEPLQKRNVSLSLLGNGNENNLNLNYQFGMQLQVNNGNVSNVEINVINHNPKIYINQKRFEVGTRPWFEIIVRCFIIQNISLTTAKICINTDKLAPIKPSIINGFFKIQPKISFIYLDAGASIKINAIFALGFGSFVREIGIEVNNKPPISIHFSGIGQIPLFTILRTPRLDIFNKDFIIEYTALKTMFNEQVKNISVSKKDYSLALVEKWKKNFEEYDVASKTSPNNKKSSQLSKRLNQENENSVIVLKEPSAEFEFYDFCETCATSCSLFCIDEVSFDLLKKKDPIYPANLLETYDMDLLDYCVLDYPNEYPNQANISNFIDISNLIAQYYVSEEIQMICKQITNLQISSKINSKNIRMAMKYEPPLGHVTVSILPLPLIIPCYFVDFGDIYIPQKIEIVLTIFYHGPGKMNAALRTLVYIPGLKIQFFQLNPCFHVNTKNKFNIVNYTPNKTDIKPYININERLFNEINSEAESLDDDSVHPHSFDYDSVRKHTRQISYKKRKEINNYYTKISTNANEVKKANIHSEIFQENLNSTENEKIHIQITFKPPIEYYYDNTEFDDVIFLDIHLGPSIPIHLKGFLHYLNG